MSEELVFVGFGGHAKSIADAVERQNLYKIVGYTDIEEKESKYKYLGKDDALKDIFASGVKNAIIALGYIGNGNLRETIYSKLKTIGFSLPTIIDPSATVSDTSVIDEGTFIGKGAVVNCEAVIGKCCIINTGAIIEHECVVRDFSHIAVGAVLCGQVKIGESVFIGANSTVIQAVEVFDNEIIPAGEVLRRKTIVFGSVIYSAAVEYLDDFIESINNQTNQNFDLLVINDDIKDYSVIEKIRKKVRCGRVIVKDYSDYSYGPAKLRVELIKQAKLLGYKLIVLGDCDDTFSKNRVEYVFTKYLRNKNVAFFYNDLVSDNTSVFASLPDHVSDIEGLMQFNFVGLSTSAINLNVVSLDFIDSMNEFDGFVFDWYLFSRLILDKQVGVFVQGVSTKYGIHDNNFAGINDGSREIIEREIEVKKKHYKALAKYNVLYEELLDKVTRVNVDKIDGKAPNQYWWSNIIF